jgi:hypothetical protein
MGAVKNLSDRSVPIHDEGGRVQHVLPGDVFPPWAVVANESVLGDQELPDATLEHYHDKIAELDGVESSRSRRQRAAYQKLIDDAGKRSSKLEDKKTIPPTEGVPPRNGPGSGLDVWRDYAIDQDVDIEEDWTKEQIIAELEAAGKPV